MSVKVSGFDWDDHNREKCQKRGVSLAEIEALFSGPLDTYPDPVHSHEERRMLATVATRRGVSSLPSPSA